MSDIVQRLREEHANWKCGDVVIEAAAEIERLRAALTIIADGKVDWAHKPADEMRDIARAALKPK